MAPTKGYTYMHRGFGRALNVNKCSKLVPVYKTLKTFFCKTTQQNSKLLHTISALVCVIMSPPQPGEDIVLLPSSSLSSSVIPCEHDNF